LQTLANQSGTATLTDSQVTGAATNSAGATLAVNGGGLGSLTNAGEASLDQKVQVAGDVTNANALTIDASSVDGTTTNTGTLTVQNASLLQTLANQSGTATLTDSQVAGVATNSAGATLAVNGGKLGSLSNAGEASLTQQAQVTGDVTNANALTIDASSVAGTTTNTGTLTVQNAALLQTLANQSGTATLTGSQVTGVATNSAGATLAVNGGKLGSLSNAGEASLTQQAQVAGDVTNANALTIDASAVDGTTTNTGTLTAQNASLLQTIDNQSGTATLTGSQVTGVATNSAGASLAVNGGKLGSLSNAGEASLTQQAQVAGDVTNANALTIDASSVAGSTTNTGTLTVQNASLLQTLANQSGTATLTGSQVTGAATNSAGATLALNGGSVASVTNAGTASLATLNTVQKDVHNNAGSLTLDGNTIRGQLFADGGTFSVTSNGTTIGTLSGSANGTLNGLLYLASADSTYSGVLSGSGSIKIDASDLSTYSQNTLYGQQVFDGDNSYTGNTDIDSGSVVINGNQSRATGDTSVNLAANLLGTGTLGGNLTVEQGGSFTPGDTSSHTGTFSVLKNLTLDNGSSQYFYLGQTGVSGGAYNAFVSVGGNLTLGGTLNIIANTAGPNAHNSELDQGLYRLYTYGGALSGVANQTVNTSTIAQGGNTSLQTAIAHQVNLIAGYGPLTFWDGGNSTQYNNGSVDGGSGVWTAQTGVDHSNWTNQQGIINGSWHNGDFVIYAGNAGTVTVQDQKNGQDYKVIFNGMQFANNDGQLYKITGDDVYAATASTTIRVGDGTSSGANIAAVFDTVLNDQYVTGGTSLLKTDLGTLIISKNQSYRGATTISGGTLQLGNGGTTGALTGSSAIHNNGSLVVDRSNTLTIVQTIDGQGSLVQNGSGTTVLSANNSYTGNTTVARGTLAVDGSIASSSVTALSGSTLSGTGTVGNTVIAQGATLAPTGTQGSLTVQGNLQINANALLALAAGNQLSGKTMVFQGKEYQQLQSAFVQVTGSAALAGSVAINVATSTPMRANEYYTLVSTGKGFTQKTYDLQGNLANIYTFLSPTLYYNGTDLDLLMSRNSTSFSSVGQSRNEQETGQGIDHLPQNSALVQAMESLNATRARQSMNALSGEVHASARTALIQDSLFVRQAVMDRLDTAECNNTHVDATLHTASLKTGRKDEGCLADQPVLWGEAYGSLGHNSGDGNAAGMHHSTTGFIMGIDAPIMENRWRIGTMLSYGRSMFDVGSGRGSSGHSNNVTLGGYAGTHWGALNLKLGAAYTWNMLSLQRNVALPGYSDRLSSSYLGGTAQGFGELGYRFRIGQGIIEPFANVAYVNLHTNGYHEHGGPSALRGRSMDTGVTFSTFGVKASASFHAGKLLLVPHGSLAYRHAFGLTTPTAHTLFATAGSGSMDIAGVPLSTNAAVIDTGLTARLTDRLDVGLSYICQYGNQSVESGAKTNL
ncbi:MAG: autotransporter domain-containing protein, partial [Acetobacter syzygii]